MFLVSVVRLCNNGFSIIPQIINVYNQEYESAAAFWPDVHGRVITALVVSQLLLMGLISTKELAQATPFLIVLPVLTISFHRFCKGRYEPAFIRYPLQVSGNSEVFKTVVVLLFIVLIIDSISLYNCIGRTLLCLNPIIFRL